MKPIHCFSDHCVEPFGVTGMTAIADHDETDFFFGYQKIAL
jgi:hypothetical protein